MGLRFPIARVLRFSHDGVSHTCGVGMPHLREVRRTGTSLILEATVQRHEALPLIFDEIILRALAPDQTHI